MTSMEKDGGKITVYASAITKDEQLDICRSLVKNGYTVNTTKGKVVNGRGVSYINYWREEANSGRSI